MTPRPRDDRLGAGLADSNGHAPFTARLWWIPQQDLKHQPGTLAMNGEEIDLAFPVHIAPDGIWLALGSVQRLEISTSVVLPDSGLPMPEQLWDIEVGTMHIRELANGWRPAVCSASVLPAIGPLRPCATWRSHSSAS